jgi:predicted nucleotidyltransferase
MARTFSCDLLNVVQRARRIKRQAQREAVLKHMWELLPRLAARIQFEEAYVFGSVLNSKRFQEDSDVDVAFVGLQDEDFFPTMAWLSRELGREVDVIQLEGHRLSDKIRKEGLRWTRRS